MFTAVTIRLFTRLLRPLMRESLQLDLHCNLHRNPRLLPSISGRFRPPVYKLFP